MIVITNQVIIITNPDTSDAPFRISVRIGGGGPPPGSENPVFSYLVGTCHLVGTSADSERLTDRTLVNPKIKLQAP